jgi:hypothetical protein
VTEEHSWDEQTNLILSKENREIPGDEMIDNLLDIEGVDKEAPDEVTRSRFDQLSKKHFRIILEEEDPRWRLVYKMARLEKENIFKGEHFEHALRADYLSQYQSIRRGWSRYIDQVTITQLARALANIEIGNEVSPLFNNLTYFNGLYEEIYEPSRIGVGHKPDERGVTGSQEALWQLLLMSKLFTGETYLGRIGFNFHIENHKRIVSISNIQGSHNKEKIEVFENVAYRSFSESLIFTLKQKLGQQGYEYRGVKGRKENPALYSVVFKKLGIETYPVNRLYGEKYIPAFEEIFNDSI